MTRAQQTQALAAAGCEVRDDALTRRLHATDASHYEVEPLAVAFPRSAAEAAAVVRAAADAGVPVTPRGAGTGLVGGALGEGLVVDFARHNRAIASFDRDTGRVTAGAGVVLDALNDFLRPRGLMFGPDVATSSRATIGGMIANNSSGARAPRFGPTADHVVSLRVVLADGALVELGGNPDGPPALCQTVGGMIERHATALPRPLAAKRRPGYGVDRFHWRRRSLAELIAGSEGTLAGIWSAELQGVPLPREKGLGLVCFESVAEAMQATVSLLDLQPVAIELVDRVLLDQTRGQLPFQAARDLLELDTRAAEAVLLVEFYEDVEERLAALATRRLGRRARQVTAPAEMNLVWALRKAGLSLLTGCAGPAKPVTCIEDTAVPPEKLPAYIAALRGLLARAGLRACFYGHAASGLLHVRPVLDLGSAADQRKFRQITADVAALVRDFDGSFAAEHGVGIARTEFLEAQVGAATLGLMREIKRAFDPRDVFNPGKVIPSGRWRLDGDLRTFPREGELPFAPVLAFAAKDGSFLANLAQCNGCGGCLKQSPTMCPTFPATGDELLSTRGRANLIRGVLGDETLGGPDPLRSAALEAALSNCLSCKACTTECPSNVNLTLLKAELTHARLRRDGLGLREWVVSAVDLLGRAGCLAPGVANAVLKTRAVKALVGRVLGLAPQRALPPFARERFDRWFARRSAGGRGTGATPVPAPARGRVLLWDDTFVRYHEPEVGRAAVAALEAAGFEVLLPAGRQCCGRPAFSQGNLDEAARLGRHNLALLAGADSRLPVLFLEPSCWSMFAEDYRELNLPQAAEVGRRCFLFEQFVEDLLAREPAALRFRPRAEPVAIHAHCHAKALARPALLARLAGRLPGRRVTLLDTGCCGMAGAFGMLEAKYELSLRVAAPLVAALAAQPPSTTIVASGTSCRQQIRHLTPAQPRHPAELLASALAP